MTRGQRIFKFKGISIEERPEVVNTRSRIGVWEGDTVESCDHKPGVNTLVERKTGYTFITKLKDKTATSTVEVVTQRMSVLPRKAKHTLTLDNGPENSDWQSMQEKTKLSVFSAHPYSSWERGTNENTNGLIRWYFPKGTDFATISNEDIKAVETSLNNRPRKRLGWRTPLEVFNESVALQG